MEPRGRNAWMYWGLCASVALTVSLMGGCAAQEPPKAVARYENLGPKKVPAYLQGTILERTDLLGTEPFGVSAYGLVANLRNTGDNTAVPTAVRDYMIREMVKHKFGQPSSGLEEYPPEKLL